MTPRPLAGALSRTRMKPFPGSNRDRNRYSPGSPIPRCTERYRSRAQKRCEPARQNISQSQPRKNRLRDWYRREPTRFRNNAGSDTPALRPSRGFDILSAVVWREEIQFGPKWNDATRVEVAHPAVITELDRGYVDGVGDPRH